MTVRRNRQPFFRENVSTVKKTKQKITADKQIITLSGEALFNGDIAPDTDVISGEVVVLTGIRRKIYASEKAKNPDGTVNYTRLELI